MSHQRKVLVYGASGYTGKIIAESLAQRDIPFYMSGRNEGRLKEAIKIVEERHGAPIDAEIAVASNSPDELRPWFEKVDVVINVSGPFMRLGWPIVETALECGCHCNEQLFLELNEYWEWAWDTLATVTVPYRAGTLRAFPWGGEISAESAKLLLAGKLLKPGFQSPATTFNHRELIHIFCDSGFTSAPPAPGSM
jgi:NAD(P)-dependent dehydrogenase (short-subunit alcohol dehydrogenase family)